MEPFYFILTGVLGLAIGSFLNVLIYRLPRKKPIVLARSVCTRCGNRLMWYHNIPLVSFACLGGRCAYCTRKISWRYPIVEAVNGLLYVYFLWQFGLTEQFFVFAFLSSVLLAIFFIDLDHQIIPDSFTLPGIGIGLAVSLIPGGLSPLSSLIGLLVGGGSLYIIAILGDWIFKKESMGGGDIKMAAMLGAFLGWQKVLFIFISAAAIGLVVSIAVMIFSKRMREERIIPFGPFLSAAAVLAIVYGDQLIRLYIDNFVHIN
jgi:leader peptidase (prepilin peptidase)/N-methyltransferase